jgi:cysteine desulfurase
MSTGERIVVDALGTMCPVPTIRLARAAERAAPGTIIELLADDPVAAVDIPAWCHLKEHEFLGQEQRAAGTAYVVRVPG